jgi:hypothetical protein
MIREAGFPILGEKGLSTLAVRKAEGRSVNVVLVVVLSSAISAVIGVFGLLVAQRERRRGSAWWAWVVPGAFGVLLIVLGLLRLIWAL